MRSHAFASTRERVTLWFLALALVFVLAVHAAIETLFVLPANPIGELVRPAVLAYTHPYFEQYWNVFAPTPIEDDVVILARTRPANGPPSEWLDLTAPLLEQDRAFPLSRASTLKVVAMSLATAALNDKALGTGKLTASRAKALADPRTRPMVLEGLIRLAIFLHAGDAATRDVQISIVRHEFPRFTHRNDSDDSRQHNDTLLFPWLHVAGATGAQVAS